MGLHDVDGQVVDGGAVDQHVLAAVHRRHDAGNRHRGAQRVGQAAVAMLERAAVVRLALMQKYGMPQILDEHVAVFALAAAATPCGRG